MTMPAHLRFHLLSLCLLLLAGCTAPLRSTYQTPAVTLPGNWHHGSAAIDRQLLDHWWQRFDDPTLDRLIEEVLDRNNDLAAATILVRRAQLQAELAGSARLPSLSAQGNGAISHGLGGSEQKEIRNFSLSASVSYEVDLWGKLGSRYDAAKWRAQATEEDLAATALSLIATTATGYYQIAYLNWRINLSEQSIAYARRTLELAQVQLSAGTATKVELLEAERNLASQEADHTTLLQQREESRSSLAILFNGPPATLPTGERQDLSGIKVPEVAADLPADLLARRPDLRGAESRLRAALATTDAIRVSYYPSLSLTGNLGSSSADLRQLLNNPIATLGSQLLLPFLEWRDMQRNIKISESEYEEAIIRFRQTLYTAMADVEDSLSARMQYLAQEKHLEVALQSARGAEDLYRIRYQAGSIAIKDWLDAQENRRQAEITLAQNRFNQIVNHITLTKALGGDAQRTD
jgi:NodT family efflux transporter outer membrane factor (OMF) lipoprotein